MEPTAVKAVHSFRMAAQDSFPARMPTVDLAAVA